MKINWPCLKVFCRWHLLVVFIGMKIPKHIYYVFKVRYKNVPTSPAFLKMFSLFRKRRRNDNNNNVRSVCNNKKCRNVYKIHKRRLTYFKQYILPAVLIHFFLNIVHGQVYENMGNVCKFTCKLLH